jgi:hypothetical protein
MQLLQKDLAHIAAFNISRGSYRLYIVERDARAIESMRDLAATFWERNVLGGIPPLPANDDREGWARISDAMGRVFRGGAGALSGAAAEALVEHVAEYETARRAISDLDKAKDAAAAHIKAILGDHEAARIESRPDISILWAHRKGRVDHEAVAGEAFAALGAEGEALKAAAIAKHTKEPVRALTVTLKKNKGNK